MTDTTQPAAEAVATPAVDPNAQVETPATTTETTAQPAEPPAATQAEDGKAEQLRDTEGKFLPKHPRVEKLQSAINELTRQKHDTARDVERLRAEAAELQKQLQSKPQIDPQDFEGLQAHAIQRAIKAERLEDTVSKVRDLESRSAQTTQQLIAAQVEEMREHIPDIDSIFLPTERGGPNITPLMGEALSRVENGALVAYHLFKNPREAARLCRADAATVFVEIGKLAAGVKATPTKRISQAPAPVSTVSGGSSKSAAVDLSTADYETYKKVRMGQAT
jgi:hypothetical protein